MAQKAFKPTAESRRRVSILAGAGWPHEEIAICLGIARNTLSKYFSFELSVGAHQARAEVFEAMHKAAENGNVAAQKAYAAMTPKLAAPPAPPPADEKPEGKKAQAQAAAVTAQAGTDWADLLTAGPVQ